MTAKVRLFTSVFPCHVQTLISLQLSGKHAAIADGTQRDCLGRGVDFQSKLLQPGCLASCLVSEGGSFIHSQSTHRPPSFFLGWCFYWRHCWIWASHYPALLLLFKNLSNLKTRVNATFRAPAYHLFFLYNRNNAVLNTPNTWSLTWALQNETCLAHLGLLLQKAELPKGRISNPNLPSVILKGWSLALQPQTKPGCLLAGYFCHFP